MKSLLLSLCTALLLSCNNSNKEMSDSTAIRNLLEQERKAHFNKDVDLFVSEFAKEMYSVNKGAVDSLPVEEHKKRIRSYFEAVKFIKWDDVAEPIIRFSDDHSMAYAIVQKQVILETKDSTGKSFMDTIDYAWTSIYQKQNNEWKIVNNTSTNK